MKNKKGFTLIELLAVIVILAIIALIATPIVLNMIESARKSAAKSSSLGFIDSVEYYSGFAGANGDEMNLGDYDSTLLPTTNTICTKESTGWTTCEQLMAKVETKTKGKIPEEAQISLDTNGKVRATSWLKYNGYYCVYNGSDIEGDCTKTKPSDAVVENDSSSTPSVPVPQYVYGTEKLVYAGDGSTERPTNKRVYLKYRLTDGEIASGTKPEACLYSETYDGELCLTFNSVSDSLNNLKQYFGWDDSNNSSSYSGVSCSFGVSSSCSGSNLRGIVESSGNVYVYDDAINFRCSITNSYSDRCE